MTRYSGKIHFMAAIAAGLLSFGAWADVLRTVTVTSLNRGPDGETESIDLAFGSCEPDYAGSLYVAYGAAEGDVFSPTNGWDHAEKLSDDITASVTTWHYPVPEGWGSSVTCLKFFLFAETEGYRTIKDYYVQDGLVAMFDGVDNVGTGTHDATATKWKNLADGTMYDWIGNLSWVNGNALRIDDETSGFPFAPNGLGRIWTLQIALTGRGSGTFLDSQNDSLWCNGNPLKIWAQSDSVRRPSLNGWSKTETLTICSTESWYGVYFRSCSGEDHWNKIAFALPSSSGDFTVPVCFGGGKCLGGDDGSDTAAPAASIRIYDRALTAAELSANEIIDQARFYGNGSIPPLGEPVIVFSGMSDPVWANSYATVSLDQLGEPTETSVSVRLTIEGFDPGARFFDFIADFTDGSKQIVASGVKMGETVDATVTGLAPGMAYGVRFYAAGGDLVSPKTEIRTFTTRAIVVHPGQTLEGGRTISIARCDRRLGRITSIDLAFGRCPADWQGNLYVAYGPVSGDDMSRVRWTVYEKLSETPLTAADETFHYDVPEGWGSTVWALRFFFEIHTEDFLNASSYYVQDGLIAMWDGLDNVGTGEHDDSSLVWKDLVGANDFDILVPGHVSFASNCLACTANQSDGAIRVQARQPLSLEKDGGIHATCEIFYKQTAGNCMATFFRKDGFGKIIVWNTDNITYIADANGVQDGKTPWRQAMNFPGLNRTLHDSIVVDGWSGENDIVGYLDGEDATSTVTDWWYAIDEPTLFSEAGNSANRGALGEVYAVRVYDRPLTQEEVRENIRVDGIRYLGEEGVLTSKTSRDIIVSSSGTICASGYRFGTIVILK